MTALTSRARTAAVAVATGTALLTGGLVVAVKAGADTSDQGTTSTSGTTDGTSSTSSGSTSSSTSSSDDSQSGISGAQQNAQPDAGSNGS